MKKYLACFLLLMALGPSTLAAMRLPSIFADNMVLQRDVPVKIWGWSAPGQKIAVALNAREASATAGKDGRWQVTMDPIGAGGPYEIVVRGDGEVRLRNVLFGDVWICGGQSNMQWAVSQTGFQESDSTFLNTAQVRLFTVHVAMDYMPQEDVKGTGWLALTKESMQAFSAVAFHFGKFLNQELNVPIGLISDNLGATSAETWMSNDALKQFPQFDALIGPVVKQGKSFAELRDAFEKTKEKWYAKYYYRGPGMDQQWFLPSTDISDWKPIDAPGNTWEEVPDLKGHDGAVWFRTTFNLPPDFKGDSYHLGLGQIDDYDIVWVNGKKVGEGYGKHNHRNYQVLREVLREKDNVLVVRVFDVGGIGGFTTHPFWGNDVIKGKWAYKKGATLVKGFPQVKLPNSTPFSSPAVLFNGSVAPLTRLAVKGVIWYQGESNADRAHEYRTLFPALITDWRTHFGNPGLPFLFVQLANYGDEPKDPAESNWAELREAQTLTLSLPHTGMATAIDIGEAQDIHPKNKQDVGSRLGKVALRVAYSQNVVSSGPVYKSMKIEGSSVVIGFSNADGGLVTRDKYGYVRGFQVAGEDRRFYWAKASVKGGHVVVTCDQVARPVAVRYAWANNPGPLDLYNAENLPAVPFRTDSWAGATDGKVFTEGPRF